MDDPEPRTNNKNRSSVSFDGRHFIDTETEQVISFRGVSLSGCSKLPSKPDGRTHQAELFFEHRQVSFVGHPLKLEHAPHYLSQLVSWGFNLIRLVICWEALEHSGPGIYDLEYIDYITQLVQICEELNLNVLVDAHQDVWSRLCGGSGAPGWTLELAGFEIANLSETGAAALQQLGAPKGVWPSGYQKLAAGTMFTLFFSGDKFAPNRKVKRNLHQKWAKEGTDGEEMISLQEFLQSSMVEAFGQLADSLSRFDCVIGFEPMNEPHRGFINLHSPHQWNPMTDLFIRDCPSFLEAVALGEGHSQRIDVYTPTWPVPSFRFHTRRVKPEVRAWKSSVECIWKEHGVWRWDEKRNKPVVLKPKHFNLDPLTGKPFDFYSQALYPFVSRFAKRVQRYRSDWIIPVGPIPNEFYPKWDSCQRPKNLIAGPHFYDLFSLVHKAHGTLTMDVQGICMNKPIWKWMHFGHIAAKKNYTEQIKNIVNSVYNNLGEIPCLIGELGICMDLNRGEAFKTGNYYWQHYQMNALLSACESNLVSHVLWNFNPYNTDEYGDGWNGENFSFISQSEVDSSSPYSQPRILSAIVRPSARKVSGIPCRSTYDSENSTFEFEHKNPDLNPKGEQTSRFKTTETEIFLPAERFPVDQIHISISDGNYSHEADTQLLIWKHSNLEPGAKHWIKITSPIRVKIEKPVSENWAVTSWLSLTLLLSLAVALLALFWSSDQKISL
ncbi:hypothetical protein PSTG_00780 [Puccinia striiformis f. sp. tritici PST-78]|uniref:Glycoside hydrolase family 5 domain-containing protein n=1 Tax=Puccinia striiformis f. sp. tritici PST-78 TaxID=1165861 RepID=A0A0L0W3Z6_9BASI|nr:hypothetical protein PSTG_00780 [Puccinia striiformis f. sp. tritici PST-78]